MQKNRSLIKAVFAMIASLSMLLGFACALPAYAHDTHQTHQSSGIINVDYQHDSAAIANASMHLYYVAQWSPSGGYEPVGDFANPNLFPVNWQNLNAKSQTYEQNAIDFANTLASYIDIHHVQASRSTTTDEQGVASFTGLQDGLYLLTADSVTSQSLHCVSSAMLVALPSHSDGQSLREISLQPKTNCEVPHEQSLHVQKVWNDGNIARPESIRVQLLRNGAVEETVELNAANEWQYTWQHLSGEDSWSAVEERVPDGYTVMNSLDVAAVDSTAVTITNTKPVPTPQVPAQTGSQIAILAVIVIAAVALGVLLVVQARRDVRG